MLRIHAPGTPHFSRCQEPAGRFSPVLMADTGADEVTFSGRRGGGGRKAHRLRGKNGGKKPLGALLRPGFTQEMLDGIVAARKAAEAEAERRRTDYPYSYYYT